MPQVTIYHNPRCSKSRETLALLKEQHIDPTIIEYLNSPPSSHDIKTICSLLKMTPRDLMRKKENVYKELNLGDDNLSEQQLIEAMCNNPILIERPIVITDNKAALGRPPENVLEIL